MALTKRLFANNVRTTLAGSISTVGLTITFATGSGATMPNPNNANGEYFEITLQDAATGTLNEIIAITAMTGDIGTIPAGGRGQQGTSAKAWNAGDTAFLAVTKGALSDYIQPAAIQEGQYTYADASGSTTAYTAVFNPAIAILTDGMTLSVDTGAVGTNTTTTPTFSPNGLTAHTIVNQGNIALAIGDLPKLAHIQYDSTISSWVLLNPLVTNSFVTKTALQNEIYRYVTAGGTADAITATYTPALTALVDGTTLFVATTATNATATPTFSPNGLTAKIITLQNNVALSAKAMPKNAILQYNATTGKWILLNPLFTSVTSRGGGTGYKIFDDGQIIQWGVVTVGSPSTITFPITFPNSVDSLQVSESNAQSSTWGLGKPSIHGYGNVTTTGYSAWAEAWTGSSWTGGSFAQTYFAIGN